MKNNLKKFTQAKVLLVEDDEFAREIIEEMLKILGAAVDSAENGTKALNIVEQKDYDLILLDLNMPDKDGIQVCREIRQKNAKKQPAIVALTAADLEIVRESCLIAGMDGFVTKPVEIEQLENVLSTYLNRQTQQE